MRSSGWSSARPSATPCTRRAAGRRRSRASARPRRCRRSGSPSTRGSTRSRASSTATCSSPRPSARPEGGRRTAAPGRLATRSSGGRRRRWNGRIQGTHLAPRHRPRPPHPRPRPALPGDPRRRRARRRRARDRPGRRRPPPRRHEPRVPKGLLTRAWLRSALGDPDGARADLDEAQEIAERGPMPLFLADIHLYRARLFHDRAALAEARRLIEKHGYGRRREELADLEEAARSWPQPNSQRNPAMPESAKRFRVALSFAASSRPFVELVPRHWQASLASRECSTTPTMRRNLRGSTSTATSSASITRVRADRDLPYADNERKESCGLEWRAIRDLIKKRKGDSVMPLRFDATEIPALFSGRLRLDPGPHTRRDRRSDPRAPRNRQARSASVPTAPGRTRPYRVDPAGSAALRLGARNSLTCRSRSRSPLTSTHKYRLQNLIAEAQQKIREHGGEG